MPVPEVRHRSSAIGLTLLFAALIVYASLYPFVGWRMPGVPIGQFLLLPWPRWWTWFDLTANLFGYIPLGGLLFVAFIRSGWRSLSAFSAACLLAGALSLSMETLQNFLPQRIPSNVDAGLNLAGAAAGAALGALAQARGGIARWQTLRDHWFSQRSASGLVLLLMWPVALLFPLPLPLGLGQVLPRLRSLLYDALQDSWAEPWAEVWLRVDAIAPALPPAGEFMVVVLGLLGPCLVAYSVSIPGWRRVALGMIAPLLAVTVTALVDRIEFRTATRVGLGDPADRRGPRRRIVACPADGWAAASSLGRLGSDRADADGRAGHPGPGRSVLCDQPEGLGAGTFHPFPRPGPMGRMALALCGDVASGGCSDAPRDC